MGYLNSETGVLYGFINEVHVIFVTVVRIYFSGYYTQPTEVRVRRQIHSNRKDFYSDQVGSTDHFS